MPCMKFVLFGLIATKSTVLYYVLFFTSKCLKKLSGALPCPIFTSDAQVHWFVNRDVSACLCTSLLKHSGSSQVSRHHTYCLLVPGGSQV